MKLQSAGEHPHGRSAIGYDSLFTRDKIIMFAFHGYPWLIDRLPQLAPPATTSGR